MTINKPIFSHNMALYQSILENAAWNTQFLLDNDLFDEKTFGPKIDEIEKTIIPHYYEHPQEELPSVINECVRRAYQAGAACEALGDSQGASAWYRTGQHAYRSGWLAGENFALSQEPAAICAALAGNDNRAPDLFTYMAQNYSLSFAEAALAYYEETRQYQAIWQPLGFWIFSLSWLGDWQEVLRLAEIGREAIEKTRRAGHPKDFREPQLLIDIGNTLAAYFLHPDEDGRLIARNALRVDKIPDSYTLTRFNMLPYLFIISHKYPEINPYEISRDSASAHAINIINKNLTEHDFQKALDEILQEAKYRKREYVTISSITVHLRAGGYPARQHQMDLCRAVMIKNLPGDKTRFTQPLGDNIVLATFPTRQR